ncbi:GntR family transcriptional regulator [Rhodococcus sp. Leaf7]|uniref:GntR family transcriptional regulator n=1 Tax=unclassified Rhodococcus (in: high G+C Gram-positive bacteria) TaxID=192944 RepID=UPI0006F4BCA8|nr:MULTISPECIES: GntR family transcriptional regulator [unclassified Rhodococcus (in: high G+C Gram-positive bacteria)]KQU04067.1 GntR family transcriptional regulator [Rhodococcus sp. Leaf7]KQU40251.1 GntR family transcriptional regulator [Rhodococcus sp. Leaf247]
MPARRRSVLLAQLTIDAPGGSQSVILDELRRVVMSGDAPPGTPIPLGEVAELFGVSRIPVRESLKTLIGEGLVDHRPNAGYTVAQLTSAELREMYIVREVLETAALAASAQTATEQDHALAVAVDAELRGSIDDPSKYHRLSREFHMALARPSGMGRLLHMLAAAWNITEPLQPMVHVAGADRAALHADHQDMLDAFVARDTPALLAAASRHHDRLNVVISRIGDEAGLRPDP